MEEIMIQINLWLYGPLSNYCGQEHDPGYANIFMKFHPGAKLRDVLNNLQLPAGERGITFINGNLSAMPGLQPDLDTELFDGDRVAMFHLNSMWPFQYRHDASMTTDMSQAMQASKDSGLHHTYKNTE